MEKKLLLQEISDFLAAREGMPRKKAETYSRLFFEIIEEGLVKDKFVKIKGFGTFKLVPVSDRESVDVNTGERIQISGHSKVTFTPDAMIKDLINRPFSHFQTVVLNEETDVNELDTAEYPAETADEDADNAEDLSDDTAPAEPSETLWTPAVSPLSHAAAEAGAGRTDIPETGNAAADAVPAVSRETDADPTTAENQLQEEQSTALLSAKTAAGNEETADSVSEIPAAVAVMTSEENTVNAGDPADTADCALDTAAADGADGNTDGAPDVPSDGRTGEDTESAGNKDEDSNDNTDMAENQTENAEPEVGVDTDNETLSATNRKVQYVLGDEYRQRNINWWKVIALSLFALLLLIMSYFAGYYKVFCPPCNERQAEVIPLIKLQPAIPVQADSVKVATDSVATDSLAATAEPVQPQQPASAASPQQPAGGTAAAKRPAVHVVKRGESLYKIAARIYGDKKYAADIIRYNNIKNPDNIEVGVELKLPDIQDAASRKR